jgi:hypothetical protein
VDDFTRKENKMSTTTKIEEPVKAQIDPSGQPREMATQKDKPLTPAQAFGKSVTDTALAILSDIIDEDRARVAAGRVALALRSAASSARNPSDFHDCTKESVGRVIAISALTNIMPSTGATALAYAIPRRARKGEQPQLTYQLSHRGINALANRAGMHMVAIPISHTDEIQDDGTGNVVVKSRDFDNPPTTEEELRGVIVQVRSLKTGLIVCSGWVPLKLILARRAQSDGYNYAEKPGNDYAKESDPWHKWFVEQSMKTAMHYAIGRGWCVIDDTEAVKALAEDAKADYIDGEVVRRVTPRLIAKQEDPTG